MHRHILTWRHISCPLTFDRRLLALKSAYSSIEYALGQSQWDKGQCMISVPRYPLNHGVLYQVDSKEKRKDVYVDKTCRRTPVTGKCLFFSLLSNCPQKLEGGSKAVPTNLLMGFTEPLVEQQL